MTEEQQQWFLAHEDTDIDPTEAIGMTWYIHQEPDRIQCVASADLAAVGLSDPMDHPGMKLWLMDRFNAANAPSSEAADRKARSIAALTAKQIATIDHLPVIEDSSQAVLRGPAEVGKRVLALLAVAVKGQQVMEGSGAMFPVTLAGFRKQFGDDLQFTPAEQAFIDDDNPHQSAWVQFVWRYEALHALLWALGHVNELEHPSSVIDVPELAKLCLLYTSDAADE